jgi:antitoxin PrlF
MKRKTYPVNAAKIGNQQGFRLPRAFYQDNPHFTEISGEIEVINEDTLLIRLDAKNSPPPQDEEDLMMSLFLDFLMKDVITNPEKLIPYTEEMSKEIDDLLADVNLNET